MLLLVFFFKVNASAVHIHNAIIAAASVAAITVDNASDFVTIFTAIQQLRVS